MATTAGDLINLALKMVGALGVGQTALAEDSNDAFNLLNFMVAQWNRRRWLTYYVQDLGFTSDGRIIPYTVGPAGNYSTSPRPTRLEAAYVRQLTIPGTNQPDTPLEILWSHEDYSRVDLKSLISFPQSVFLDSQFPTANLYVYPWPNASQYSVHILIKFPLTQFTLLSTAVSFPDEYKEALLYNLAVRLGPMYPISKDPTMLQQWEDTKSIAKSALNTLRLGNAQVGRLLMPQDLTHNNRYNIFNDTNR